MPYPVLDKQLESTFHVSLLVFSEVQSCPFIGFKDPKATTGTPTSEPSVLPRDFQIHFTDEAVAQLQAMVTAAEGKSNQQLCSPPWTAEL